MTSCWVVPAVRKWCSRLSAFAWPNIAPAERPQTGALDATREAARQEGYAAGLAQAEADHVERQQALGVALQTLERAAQQLQVGHERAVIDLVFAALSGLLRVELTTNPDVIENLVAEALAELDTRLESVQVQVHPDDLASLAAMSELPLVADPSVPQAGVRVVLPDLSVDFDLVARVQEAAP